MTDLYSNFEHLSQHEKLNKDYVINSRFLNTAFLFMAPHGGGIEPGTSEIVLEMARDDFSFYTFDGVKSKGNGSLHITSSSFDEPMALKMSNDSDVVIAIHGEASHEEVVYLGGLNNDLKDKIKTKLIEAGFDARESNNPNLQGISENNICNKCRTRMGVQLEISNGLRKSFFRDLTLGGRAHKTEKLYSFVSALRDVCLE